MKFERNVGKRMLKEDKLTDWIDNISKYVNGDEAEINVPTKIVNVDDENVTFTSNKHMTNKEIEEYLEAHRTVFPSRMSSDELRNLDSIDVVDAKGRVKSLPVGDVIAVCESALNEWYAHVDYLPATVREIIWTMCEECDTAFTDGREIAFNPVFASKQLQLSKALNNQFKQIEGIQNGSMKNDGKITDEDIAQYNEVIKYDRVSTRTIKNARCFLFVVMHEYFHQSYQHLQREREYARHHGGCNHHLANIAEDIEINRDIEVNYPIFTGVTKLCKLLWYEDYFQYTKTQEQKDILCQGSWEDIYQVLVDIKYNPPEKQQKTQQTPPQPQEQKKIVYSEEARKAFEEAFRKRLEELKAQFPGERPVTYGGVFESLKRKYNRVLSLYKAINEAADDNIEYVSVEDAIEQGKKAAEDLFYGRNINMEVDDNTEIVNGPDVPVTGKGNGKGTSKDNNSNSNNSQNGQDGQDGNGGGGDDQKGKPNTSVVVPFNAKDMTADISGKEDQGAQGSVEKMNRIKKIAKTGLDSNISLEGHQRNVTKEAMNHTRNAQRPKAGVGQYIGDVYKNIQFKNETGDVEDWRDRLQPFFNSHQEYDSEYSYGYAKMDLLGTPLEPVVFIPTKEIRYSIVGGLLDVVFIVDNSGSMHFNYTDENGEVRDIFDKIITEILYLEDNVKVKHSALVYFAAGDIRPDSIRYWDANALDDVNALAEQLQRKSFDVTGGTSLIESLNYLRTLTNDNGEQLIDADSFVIIISDGGDDYHQLDEALSQSGTSLLSCVYLLYGVDDKELMKTCLEINKESGLPLTNIIPINVAAEYHATKA